MRKRHLIILILVLAILLNACGGSGIFTDQIKKELDNRDALLNSLQLSGNVKLQYSGDIGHWVDDAVTAGKAIDACADRPCKLTAVNDFQTRFWATLQSGRWGDKAPDKLRKVRTAMEGVILAAKIYYGFPAPKQSRAAGGGPVPEPNAANELNTKLKALREAMKVN